LVDRLTTTLPCKWEEFKVDALKWNFDPEDLRPDTLIREFNQEQERQGSDLRMVKTDDKVGAAAIGAVIKGVTIGLSGAGAKTTGKEMMDRFLKERGILWGYEGKVCEPKSIDLYHVNEGGLEITEEFTVIDDLIEPVMLEQERRTVDLRLFREDIQSPKNPFTEYFREWELRLRDIVEQHVQEVRDIKDKHHTVLQEVEGRYKAKLEKLMMQPKREEARLDLYEVTLQGCFQPTRNADTEMASNKNGCQAECQTMIVFTSTEVYLFVYYFCEELGGDHTTFAGHEIVTLYTERQGRRIVDVRCAKKGWQKFYASHDKVAKLDWLRYEGQHGSGWDYLDYKVDGPGGRDYLNVGVKGKLSDNIVVVTEQPVTH
jgi:hypothetical protein